VISIEELEDALAAQEAQEAYEAGETVLWEKVKVELAEGDDGVSD
jgi:hypothetical protein